MVFPTNTLQAVQTYQDGGMPVFYNKTPMMTILNTKFKEFSDKFTANLGDTVTLDLVPRAQAAAGLVVNWSAAVQRKIPLVCDQAFNTNYICTAQELIFNLDKAGNSYLPKFAMSNIAELANQVEINVSKNINSSAPVNNIVNGQTVPTGALHTESGPFRFFGDGRTAIDTFQQLRQSIVNFTNVGIPRGRIKCVLPDMVVPAIVGNGINQFVPRRNDEIARSWEIGTYGSPEVDYYESNVLPLHTAGTCGNDDETLTVVSTNDPTGANITQIVFSSPTATDANYIKSGDLLQFSDGVSGQPNLRFLLFVGQNTSVPSSQPVQVRATADAAASGNQVTITFTPGLTVGASQTDNWGINTNIVAGMQAKVLPSHRCGLIIAEDAGFLAMPALPDTEPFPSSSKADPETQTSVRAYYGYLFGQNQQGFVYDEIHGCLLVPERCMRVAFPL